MLATPLFSHRKRSIFSGVDKLMKLLGSDSSTLNTLETYAASSEDDPCALISLGYQVSTDSCPDGWNATTRIMKCNNNVAVGKGPISRIYNDFSVRIFVVLPHLKTILGTKRLCLSQWHLPLSAYTR